MLQSTIWHPITAAGLLHVLLFSIVIPFGALRARKKLFGPRGMPGRKQHLIRTATTLVMLGSVSVSVALGEGFNLGLTRAPAPVGVAGGLVLLLTAVTFMRPRWRKAVEQRKPVVHLFMPSDRRERILWVIVSALAGVTEEITWRGVQPLLLFALLGNRTAAIAISAVTFGMAHTIQGWKTAALIVVFALGFHFMVWTSGTLTVAMAVHFAYDTIAGITYGKLGRELGYGSDAVPATA